MATSDGAYSKSSAPGWLTRNLRLHGLTFAILRAVISIVVAALAMYFVFRWGEVLRKSNQKTRELFLGPIISGWIKNGETLSLLVSLYLGWKLLELLIQASSWRVYLERKKAVFARERQAELEKIQRRREEKKDIGSS